MNEYRSYVWGRDQGTLFQSTLSEYFRSGQLGTAKRMLFTYKVAELKLICRYYGLYVSGTKSILVDRIYMFHYQNFVREKERSKQRNPLRLHFPKWQVWKYRTCFCSGSNKPSGSGETDRFNFVVCKSCDRKFHPSCILKYAKDPMDFYCPLCIGRRRDDQFIYTEDYLMRPIIVDTCTVDSKDSDRSWFHLANRERFRDNPKNQSSKSLERSRIYVTCLDFSDNSRSPVYRWPRFFNLSINGIDISNAVVEERPNSALRYDVTAICKRGRNEIKFDLGIEHFRFKEGPFMLLTRVLVERSIETILQSIRRNATASEDEERDRMRQTLRNEEEDGIEVMAKPRISLRCPLGMHIMRVPGRGKTCEHMACFDLGTFLTFGRSSIKPSHKMKCPVCAKHLKSGDLSVSAYVQSMVDSVRPEDRDMVEYADVLPDGSWAISVAKEEGAVKADVHNDDDDDDFSETAASHAAPPPEGSELNPIEL